MQEVDKIIETGVVSVVLASLSGLGRGIGLSALFFNICFKVYSAQLSRSAGKYNTEFPVNVIPCELGTTATKGIDIWPQNTHKGVSEACCDPECLAAVQSEAQNTKRSES